MSVKTSCCTIAALVLGTAVLASAAAPAVEMQVVVEPGAPLTASHDWLKLLRDLDISTIRIRQGRAKPRIDQLKNANSETHRVTGVVTAGNELLVPGASFSLRQKTALRSWLDNVGRGAQTATESANSAFGLTAKQLVAVRDALQVPVSPSTQDQPVTNIATAIAERLTMELKVTADARRVMRDEKVRDELSGLSSGTALAALLRPLGLVLVPTRQPAPNEAVYLLITDVRQTTESWPVGWPPQQQTRKTLPKLFDFLQIEIVERPVSEVLVALRSRLEVPILLDHNSLARQRIDPAQVTVSMAPTRTFYKKVLDRTLFQARLRSELRVDERGRPLLWISPVKTLSSVQDE